MPYTIYNADGTTITVPDNANNTSFYDPVNHKGVLLVGRNKIDYGSDTAQNFLQITENFASTTPPSDATSLIGQTWFDLTTLALKVKTASSTWQPLGNINPTIGNQITDMYGSILGYATTSIPLGASVSDYVPLTSYDNVVFFGWIKLVSGLGMTSAITDSTSAILGYAFPA